MDDAVLMSTYYSVVFGLFFPGHSNQQTIKEAVWLDVLAPKANSFFTALIKVSVENLQATYGRLSLQLGILCDLLSSFKKINMNKR